jgi:hypothetical protein
MAVVAANAANLVIRLKALAFIPNGRCQKLFAANFIIQYRSPLHAVIGQFEVVAYAAGEEPPAHRCGVVGRCAGSADEQGAGNDFTG